MRSKFIKSVNILMLTLSILWLYFTKDLEPLIASIGFLSTLIILYFEERITKTLYQIKKPSVRQLKFNKREWTDIGVTGANVTSLAVSPINPKEIWFGTNQEEFFDSLPKIYRSLDRGLNWEILDIGSYNNKFKDRVRQIQISKDNNLFIATGSILLKYNISLSKWNIEYEDTQEREVRCFALHPIYQTLIYRGLGKYTGGITVGSSTLALGGFEVNESKTDLFLGDFHFWDNQTEKYKSLNISNINSIAVSDLDTSIAILGTSDNALFKVEGETVRQIGTSLKKPITIINVSMSKWDIDTIFVGTRFNGAFISTNGGESWEKTEGIPDCQVIKFEFSVFSYGLIWAGTSQGIFESRDNGKFWKEDNKGLEHLWVLGLSTNSEGEVFAGTASGIYKKKENQTNWESLNFGLHNSDKSYTDAVILNSNRIICATGDNVYITSNSGSTWRSIGYFPSIYCLLFIPLNVANEKDSDYHFSSDIGKSFHENAFQQGLLFVGTDKGEIAFTNEFGSHWEVKKLETTTIHSIKGIKNLIFAGTGNGLYISSNYGKDWDKINDFRISEIWVHENTIFIGTFNGELLKSSDYGKTWLNVSFNSTQPIMSIYCIDDEVYCCTEGEGIYKSKDSGISWVQLNNIPNNNVYSILTHNNNSNTLYIGTKNGIFKSIDSGNNWESINNGIQGNMQVNRLIYNANFDFIIACMANKGLFRVNI